MTYMEILDALANRKAELSTELAQVEKAIDALTAVHMGNAKPPRKPMHRQIVTVKFIDGGKWYNYLWEGDWPWHIGDRVLVEPTQNWHADCGNAATVVGRMEASDDIAGDNLSRILDWA